MIPPGVHYDLDEGEYRAHPALGSTDVRALLASPAEYAARRDGTAVDPPARVARFDLGHAVHSHLVGGREVVGIADAWTRQADREAREQARAEGKIPLTHDQAESVQRAAEQVLAHPDAAWLLRGSRVVAREVSLVGTVEVDDRLVEDHLVGAEVPVKGRLDVAIDVHEAFDQHEDVPTWANVDVKSTRSIEPRALRRSVAEHGYHVQAAHYATVAERCGVIIPSESAYHVWVCVTPPHRVRVTQLAAPAVERGEELCDRAYATYARCADTGRWEDDTAGVSILDLPPYAYDDDPDLEYL